MSDTSPADSEFLVYKGGVLVFKGELKEGAELAIQRDRDARDLKVAGLETLPSLRPVQGS